ncbi:glycoside hydrolase family 125 protein [Curtobacterium sp. PhB130]|uniref:glycoside hydrolase family 125 protein n=1 Tax=Curtobacterium sp. PhB130 TaxID=2485178 RepID=UPI000F4C7FC1|nr:glycoside hydrolase family 125 protein [Curtobacterium sp. PhB130]
MTTTHIDDQVLTTLRSAADRVRATLGTDIGDRVERALGRTLRETISLDEDGAFVITGDIPAMWLRDSTTQMTPYLRLTAASPALADLLWAVVRRQFRLIDHDPYANSFNREPNGAHYDPDDLNADPLVWEQKYEVDSLGYPVTFAHALWRSTGRVDVLDATAHRVFRTIVDQWRLETDHDRSAYRFVRPGAVATETLARDGRGTPVAVTGMTWSGFRPSDDACTYGYNVPANLFAAEALLAVAAIAREVWDDGALAADADALRTTILDGVARHGVVPGPSGADVYAYEVDGLGGVLLMDDANTPSLLSLPLSAPTVLDPAVWTATRDFVRSPANPFWFAGSAAAGIGSPHTLPGRAWPIALAVDGLVSGSAARRREVLDVLVATDAGTGDMHESFDVDDPTRFSRPWFSWADAMFCELALVAAED